jgi:hypothetical protein
MVRTAWLAAVALTLVIGATFAQSRPKTEGTTGPEAHRRTVGFRAVGAFGGMVQGETQCSVQLEMEGGQKLEGTVQLRPILVDSDLGQYSIHPEKIKAIRFLRRLSTDNDEENAVQRAVPPTVRRKMMVPQRDPQGNTLVPDQTSPTGTAWLTHGKVITTSGKEIVGDIHIPTDFKLELEFGTLSPAPDKLRILTITGSPPAGATGAPAEAGRPGGSGGPGRPQPPEVKKP